MVFNAQMFKSLHFSIVFFLASSTLATVIGAEEVSLQPRQHANALVRVKTVVDVAGSLHVETRNEKKLKIPMKVNAELFFDERGLSGNESPAIRHYWEAKADLVINEEEETRKLRDERQLMLLADTNQMSNRFWSPNGNLTRQELELIDVPGNAFAPELLLTKSAVSEGDEWVADDVEVARLLRLAEVTAGKLTNTVKEISDDKVTVEIKGKVEGNADGAATSIEVSGNYHFNREEEFISWFAMAIREKREIGFAAPGFEVTAQIRTIRQSLTKSEALTPQVVTQAKSPADGELLLDFASADNLYRTAIDRRWHLISRQGSSTVMRLVDGKDLLATCKVDRLDRMAPGKQITLNGFQTDVEKALAKNCKEIVSASENVNGQGLRILRVIAGGEIDETPIRWIYYHLSDDTGRRLSMIFTHEGSLESRLSGIDESLTSSVYFMPDEERQARADSAELE